MNSAASNRLAHVLWLGGMSGVGKTTAARALARRHDLRLYSLDTRTYAHASRMPAETRTLDELWVDTTPTALADWFEGHARERFPLLLEDLLALPDDAPIVVDGPQLLPELIAPLLASPDRALIIVARPELQRELIVKRGTSLYARTRDPNAASSNRSGRDEILADRLRDAAPQYGLRLAEIECVEQTSDLVDEVFEPLLSDWIARADHGDVGGRRRDENEARISQARAHIEATETKGPVALDLACECSRPGCQASVPVLLADAELAYAHGRRLLADSHT